MVALGAYLALAEGAELALEGAHVGVIDVSVDDVRHCVAADPRPQLVRCTLDSLRSQPAVRQKPASCHDSCQTVGSPLSSS